MWRGDLNGEAVAVKVMSSLLEDCWKKEQDIYLTNMLHHESILRFIAVDSKIIGKESRSHEEGRNVPQLLFNPFEAAYHTQLLYFPHTLVQIFPRS